MKKTTRAIHQAYKRRDAYDALSMPVYNAVAYEFDNAQTMSDVFCGRIAAPDYSRVGNPTVENFERRVKGITGATDVVAFNSGMAAISAVFIALAEQGKNIVSSRHMFGNTYSLLTSTLKRFGVEARLCDLTNPAEVERLLDDNTCCVYLEIMSNPHLEVVDIPALVALAHARSIPVVADTTLIPFTEFSAKALGVDAEVVSSTKYISGGATSLGGLVIDYGTCERLGRALRGELLFNFGAYMTPQAAYLQTVGLEVLDARYRIQAANALQLPQIKRVNYVGLPDNPYHHLAKKQFGNTAGAMITIDLESKAACFNMINKLKLIHRATNLFDNRTLAIHPASTIYGSFSAKERQEMDVLDTTIRLSIGLEDVDDLLEDIQQALG